MLPNLEHENIYSYRCLSCGVRFDGLGKPVVCTDCEPFYKALNRIPPPKYDLRKVCGMPETGTWLHDDATLVVSSLLGLRRSQPDDPEPTSEPQRPRPNPAPPQVEEPVVIKKEKPTKCDGCGYLSVGRCPVCDK